MRHLLLIFSSYHDMVFAIRYRYRFNVQMQQTWYCRGIPVDENILAALHHSAQ